MAMKIRPIILSGGSGTRLWPISRAKAPKQFVPLVGEDLLFTSTLRSVAHAAPFAPPMIVGNAEHKFLIQDALDEIGVTPEALFLEPLGRNTAAAALVAALAEKDHDVLHLVRPSDHVIADETAWSSALAEAVPAAVSGSIVLFGIHPDYAETGYGYIVRGDKAGFENVHKIASFKEKPDAQTAETLIEAGALWNSGIFLYSPLAVLEEAEKFAPHMLKQLRQALAKSPKDPRGIMLDAESYAALPSEPFDRVIMEHTHRGAVVPCSMGWNDVGSWQALWQTSNKDATGNATTGNVCAVDTTNSYIHSEGPLVAVLGMEDVAVVATRDAVLVTRHAPVQDMKKMVTALDDFAPALTNDHAEVRRPWGAYCSIDSGSGFQVKHITVLPGRSLSLQMHHRRSEHWIVVGGQALVELDGVETLLSPNQSIYIPKESKHRLTNPGTSPMHLIEVQYGDYLGEDDIVRFADNYGRVGT